MSKHRKPSAEVIEFSINQPINQLVNQSINFIFVTMLILLLYYDYISYQYFDAGADPGFFLGGGAPLMKDVTDR